MIFDQWIDYQAKAVLTKPKSLGVYTSMWNGVTHQAGLMNIELTDVDLQTLIFLIKEVTRNSSSSYPRRLAQLVTRVLIFHNDKNSAAAKLPEAFPDNRRKTPLFLGGTVSHSRHLDIDKEPTKLRVTPTQEWKISRAKALAACALFAGLKANEILTLEMNSIIPDNDGCIFKIKGARKRRIPIASQGHEYITEWMEARTRLFELQDQEGKSRFSTRFFIGSSKGSSISRATIHRDIRSVLVATFGDIPGNDPHVFNAAASRNAFAIKQALNGIPKHIITDWLGYKHSATIHDRISAFLENDPHSPGRDTKNEQEVDKPQQSVLFTLRPV